MEFCKMLYDRRRELNLGVREVARQTVRPSIPSPILSPVYISRLESGCSEDMPVESASIDKLWALGVVLRMYPLELFLRSRGRPDLIYSMKDFEVRDSLPMGFGQVVSLRRAELKLSMREAAEKAPWDISTAYWSQLETDFRGCSEKVSGEKLCAIGWALGIDPLLLYVLSRKMPDRYLFSRTRDALFV